MEGGGQLAVHRGDLGGLLVVHLGVFLYGLGRGRLSRGGQRDHLRSARTHRRAWCARSARCARPGRAFAHLIEQVAGHLLGCEAQEVAQLGHAP